MEIGTLLMAHQQTFLQAFRLQISDYETVTLSFGAMTSQVLRAKLPPGQSGWCEIHAEQKLLSYAKQNNIQPAEMHSAYNFCSNRGGSIPGCEQVLSRNGLMTVSPQLDTAYPVRFTQDGLNIIRNGMR